MKIGIVISRFNSEVTELLEKGALDFFEQLEGEIDLFTVRVPGAIEITLACQALLDEGCEGVVALGAVIKGETSHFDYVCSSVERGITQLMLMNKKPIGFGILTTDNLEQAMDRAGGNHGNKGTEAAQVVMEMVGLLADIQAVSVNAQKDQARKQVSKGAKPKSKPAKSKLTKVNKVKKLKK